jgi:hypothetical protein
MSLTCNLHDHVLMTETPTRLPCPSCVFDPLHPVASPSRLPFALKAAKGNDGSGIRADPSRRSQR